MAMEASDERNAMVRAQLEQRGIHDNRVLAAMARVPRHLFVPAAARDRAYGDHALPINEGQTISQPFIVALMAQALRLAPGERVLEIGAGSGYAAAVFSLLASEVYAIERKPALAHSASQRLHELGYTNVHIITGDGTAGLPEYAPFDGIAVSAAAPWVPLPLRARGPDHAAAHAHQSSDLYRAAGRGTLRAADRRSCLGAFEHRPAW
jgi:protein-L-isoaspartate(D-aspartate) O-methyltransferase